MLPLALTHFDTQLAQKWYVSCLVFLELDLPVDVEVEQLLQDSLTDRDRVETLAQIKLRIYVDKFTDFPA